MITARLKSRRPICAAFWVTKKFMKQKWQKLHNQNQPQNSPQVPQKRNWRSGLNTAVFATLTAAAALRAWQRKRRTIRIPDSLIVVTGASQGIGKETAILMAGQGGRVILLARSTAKLNELVDYIRSVGGTARAYAVDLADPAAVEAVAQRILRENGVPDIVIHNAGAGRWLAVDETTPAEAQAMLAVPYLAAFNLTHFLLPHMLYRNKGHFVIVNSPVSFMVWPGATGYAAARWALRGFAEGLRGDVRGSKINVTVVTAGETSSNYFVNNPGAAERLPKISRFIPTLTPRQVAKEILYSVQFNVDEITMPFALKLILGFQRFFPKTVTWLVRITGWKRS